MIGASIYAGIEIGKAIDSEEKRGYRAEIASLKSEVTYAQNELESLDLEFRTSFSIILDELGSIKGRLISIAAKQDANGMHSGFDSDEFNSTKERLEKKLLSFKNDNNIMEFWELEKRDLVTYLQHIKVRESVLEGRNSTENQDEAYHFIKKPVDGSDSWLSSRYGYRTDPFTGNRRWHDGVDFAGREGSDILAASSGVVTFSGDRYGYGNLVEISHSEGIVTRYGHNKKLLVETGDQVEAGDVIAEMGNSGRSTGPHLHFEVLQNGKSSNPLDHLGNPLKKPD